MIDSRNARGTIDERTERVNSLAELLNRADVTAAEKFRVVMEAWQIENDYGRTIFSYTGELDIDGLNREVAFLQIGRVSLIYQTPDGENQGVWDQANREWVALGTDYRNSIRLALRLARGQSAPALLLLPVPAPEEG